MGRIRYGIKNVYYAVATDDGTGKLTYSTPVAMTGAKSMTLSASGDDVVEYADNVRWFSETSNDGYSGTLELEEIPEAFLTSVLGQTKESASGTVFESASDTAKEFALLFQFENAGDETVTGKRGCFYRCTASRPDVAGTTKEASVSPTSETINITAMARINDDLVKASCDSAATAYATWFTAVPEKATTGE